MARESTKTGNQQRRAQDQQGIPTAWMACSRKEAGGFGVAYMGQREPTASDTLVAHAWLLPCITGELLNTLQGHTKSVWAVAVTPDGETIVSGSDDKSVRLWSRKTGVCVRVCVCVCVCVRIRKGTDHRDATVGKKETCSVGVPDRQTDHMGTYIYELGRVAAGAGNTGFGDIQRVIQRNRVAGDFFAVYVSGWCV